MAEVLSLKRKPTSFIFVQRRVEVITVVLDPTQDKCFGSSIGRALLIEWFGYETIILGKILNYFHIL